MQLSSVTKDLFFHYLSLDTSISDGRNLLAANTLLAQQLKKIGFSYEIIEIPSHISNNLPHRTNLVAKKIIDSKLPTLLIYNHIDVVPAEYQDAFLPTEKAGKIYARGAADHKGGTVAVIDALTELEHQNLRFNVIFWTTTDEETEQQAQLEYLTPYLDLPKDTIVFDTDTFAGGITIARLGFSTFELEIKGKSAHSAMSNLGKNPIEGAHSIMTFLLRVKAEFEAKESQFKAFPSSGLKHVVSRCNVTMISSGIAANVIPETATLTVNCRFIPEADTTTEMAHLLKRIKAVAQKENVDLKIKNVVTKQGHGSETTFAQELNRIYQKYHPDSDLCCIMGSCDLSGWTYAHHFPHFALGVARGESNVHGEDEHVEIIDILELSATLQEFLKK